MCIDMFNVLYVPIIFPFFLEVMLFNFLYECCSFETYSKFTIFDQNLMEQMIEVNIYNSFSMKKICQIYDKIDSLVYDYDIRQSR